MDTKDIISITTIIIGLIVTAINIVFAGKIKTLTLVAESAFKQSEKLSDKAVESLQGIVFSLRKLKEVYKNAHAQLTILERDQMDVINNVKPNLDKFSDEFINSFAKGEIFLTKNLRSKLYEIDYAIHHPSTKVNKLEALIKNIENAIDEICDLTKEIYFPLAKEINSK